MGHARSPGASRGAINKDRHRKGSGTQKPHVLTTITEKDTGWKDKTTNLINKAVDEMCGSGLLGYTLEGILQESPDSLRVLLYEREGALGGFAVVRYPSPDAMKNTRFLYIELICSAVPVAGSLMLNAILDGARKDGYDGVRLDSVPASTSFYLKHGFKFSDTGCGYTDPKFEQLYLDALPFILKHRGDVRKHKEEPDGAAYRKLMNAACKKTSNLCFLGFETLNPMSVCFGERPANPPPSWWQRTFGKAPPQ